MATVYDAIKRASAQQYSGEAQTDELEDEELQRQMEQAVAVEDFETAAALRDRLQALSEKEAAQ